MLGSVLGVWFVGLLLDALLGEPARYHPLVGFGRYAGWLETRFNRWQQASQLGQWWRGTLALLLAITPILAAVMVLRSVLGSVALLLDVVVLYLAIGRSSLRQHAVAVRDPLLRADLPAARAATGRIVSRDTAQASESELVTAVVETGLENTNDAIIASLFWYAVAGAPGVVLHRLSNTLDAMWGYRSERFNLFGRSAARLDDVLAFPSAQLLSFLFCLAALPGNRISAFRVWWGQGWRWKSINAGSVMASGSAALGLQLGGPARYREQVQDRPVLGCGRAPHVGDIAACFALQDRALGLLVALLALLAFIETIT